MKATFAGVFFIVALGALLGTQMPRKAEQPSHPLHSFEGLGDLPGGDFCSAASGVSADGSVVVGYSFSKAGMEAYRWTPRGGMMGLGFAEAHAVSANGSAVAGYRYIGDRAEPVRWTQPIGLQGLVNLSGSAFGDAFGVSGDGSVIVGSDEPRSNGGAMAFRWTHAGGLAPLKHLPDAVIDIEAYAVSSNGDV